MRNEDLDEELEEGDFEDSENTEPDYSDSTNNQKRDQVKREEQIENQPSQKVEMKQPIVDQNVTSPNSSMNDNRLNNRIGQNDSSRLRQALNKKNIGPSFPGLNKNQENSEQSGETTSSSGVKEKLGSLVDTTSFLPTTQSSNSVDKLFKKAATQVLKKKIILIVSIALGFFLIIILPIIAMMSDSTESEAATDESVDNNGGICSYKVNGNDISNVKVRLMYCDGQGSIESEELIDFEEYIVGVVYQESGGAPYEALKAQAVAARSYALMRPKAMNNSLGTSLKKENGQWILSLRSCTNDQVFCNPTKGCWSNVKGGQTDVKNPSGYRNCTVYSGQDNSKTWTRGPLTREEVRKAVEETSGQVALTETGNIAYTGFTSTTQESWTSLANQGNDYFEILKKTYSNVVSLQSNCEQSPTNNTTNNSGAFANWKQCNESWSSIKIGNSGKTICQIGCAATSTAIQIGNSGTDISISKLDPGTFVETLNKNGGFTSSGAIEWGKASVVAPKFKYIGKDNLSGNKSQKAEKLQNYINNKEYIIIGVHKSTNDSISHWVALDRVSSNDVYMFDPGSSATKLFDQYSYTKNREIAIRRYKVE